ncbi:uncharacterized protein PV09_05585 [Verruconis gallopava]|uniref:Uncharacterized protein n=1 Tax=Verruconis gallopava TaxID=253628 RepID=A0A0D1YRX7_9PEZI|nr:uncharacterized protein PV09_05585 [Verruconis gallopava]KIW03377.1 hypothetical protein PV09_05585 [Verruconis gallopava]
MDAIVQAILNLSRLEVKLIRISDQKPNSFVMELEARVVRTGPISAVLMPMKVDMVGPKGTFGVAQLPEIKTNPSGTDVHVPPQTIDIVNHEAFEAFVKSITLDEQIVLRLDNGKGKIKALFMTANINYVKDVDIPGMNGAKIEIVKTVPQPDGTFKNTIKVINPSPLEIDVPYNTFHFVDETGTVFAEQKGKLYITRGDSYHEVTGTVKAKNPKGEIHLVGVSVDQDSWMKVTITYFDSVVTLPPEMVSLTS